MNSLFVGDTFQPRPRLTVFRSFRLHIESVSVPESLESEYRLIWMHQYICLSACKTIVAFKSGCRWKDEICGILDGECGCR